LTKSQLLQKWLTKSQLLQNLFRRTARLTHTGWAAASPGGVPTAQGQRATTCQRHDTTLSFSAWASCHPAQSRHTAPGAACQAAAGILGLSSESFSLPALVRTRCLLACRRRLPLGSQQTQIVYRAPACGGLMCAAALSRLEQECQASWQTRVKPSGDNVLEDSANSVRVSRATCIPQVPFSTALFRRITTI